MPALLRPGVVYFHGRYQLVGPVTRRVIYDHVDRERVEQVRDLLAQAAPKLIAVSPWEVVVADN